MYFLHCLQIWAEILKLHPTPNFTRKAVYALLTSQTSKEWKLDPDQLVSSQKLLEASRDGKLGTYSLAVIPLKDEIGFTALAFAVPDMLKKWGSRAREISLDFRANKWL